MTRLEKLIEELCPNGVEYVKLGTFATILRGGSFQKKDFCKNGVPCIHYGQIYTKYGLFADKTLTFISEETAKKQKFAEPNDIVMAVTSENVEDVCKCLAWIGDEKVAVSGHSAIIHHNQNAKYLCYYFHTSAFFQQKRKLAHGTKVIEVKPDNLKDILIPVPPLEVQDEIIRILDNFTELTAELEAELEARKKQYEYYRDELLTFGDEVELKSLGEVCRLVTGATPSKTKNEYWDNGNIPWMSSGEVNLKYVFSTENFITRLGYDNSSTTLVPIHSIVIALAGQGKTRGKVAITEIELCTNQSLCSMICTELINYKYLYYYLDGKYNELRAISNGDGTRGGLSLRILSPYKIPVPPLEEQERIVSILDRFDKLCNDITEGLPAEIEARQKQYEYYRDKLLSFKEMS